MSIQTYLPSPTSLRELHFLSVTLMDNPIYVPSFLFDGDERKNAILIVANQYR